MQRFAALFSMKAYRIILAVNFPVLVAALTSCVCLGLVANQIGDPVQGAHTSADTELLLGAIHAQWSQEQHAILAGANPNIRDKSGEPFLNWHMRTDQTVDHLRFLIIEHAADVNIRDSKNGITPLMLARNPESIAFLISAGANLEAKDINGLTPLFHTLNQWAYLSNGGLSESTVDSNVKKLLDKGASPTTRNLQGENALFYFVRMGHEYHKSCVNCPDADPSVIVRALARAGVDLNGTVQLKGYPARSTLIGYSAIDYPDVTMVKALLAAGSHPDELGNWFFFNNVQQACPECATYAKQAYPSVFVPRPAVWYNTGPAPPRLPLAPAPGEKPEWQKHLDWCTTNSDAGGSVDCVADYLTTYPQCVASGGRSCLMSIAKTSARDHDCENAMKLALLCQCQNAEASRAISGAGEYQVCQYLGPPDPPRFNPGPPPRRPPVTTPPPTIDYYVIWRYSCQYADRTSAGDCTITQHSGVSCQDAQRVIAQRAQSSDVCKRCADVTDNSKHVVGEPQRVTGGGPCSGQ
jgi:hypothetical protein